MKKALCSVVALLLAVAAASCSDSGNLPVPVGELQHEGGFRDLTASSDGKSFVFYMGLPNLRFGIWTIGDDPTFLAKPKKGGGVTEILEFTDKSIYFSGPNYIWQIDREDGSESRVSGSSWLTVSKVVSPGRVLGISDGRIVEWLSFEDSVFEFLTPRLDGDNAGVVDLNADSYLELEVVDPEKDLNVDVAKSTLRVVGFGDEQRVVGEVSVDVVVHDAVFGVDGRVFFGSVDQLHVWDPSNNSLDVYPSVGAYEQLNVLDSGLVIASGSESEDSESFPIDSTTFWDPESMEELAAYEHFEVYEAIDLAEDRIALSVRADGVARNAEGEIADDESQRWLEIWDVGDVVAD